MNKPHLFTKEGQHLFQEAVLILGMAYMLLLTGTSASFLDERLLLLAAAVFTLVCVAWMIAGRRTRNPLGLSLVAWIGVYLLAVLLSVDPSRSASQMVLMFIPMVLFLLAYDLAARGWSAELFMRALLVAGGIFIAFGWADILNWYRIWLGLFPGHWIPDLIYRPFAANVVAVLLNIFLLCGVTVWLTSKKWVTRLALTIFLVADAGFLFLTSSRGGWLGTAVGLVVVAVLVVRYKLIDLQPVIKWLRQRPWLGGVALVLVLAGIGMVGFFLYRQTLTPSHSSSLMSARSPLWGPALRDFMRNPLMGSGPYTYSTAYLTDTSVPPEIIFAHGHGTWANLLGERGLFGTAALLWVFLSLLRLGVKRLHQAQGSQMVLLVAAAGALAAVCAHSLLDCFHLEPGGLWILAVLLGAGLGSGTPQEHNLFRPYWLGVVLVGVWASVWISIPMFTGADLSNQGNWQSALGQFQAATRRDPLHAVAWQQVGISAAVLSVQGDASNLQVARLAFEKASQLDPFWAINNLNLGAIFTAQGELPKAEAQFISALRKAPRCGICALNLGVVYEADGQIEQAQQAYMQALTLNPEMGQAYFWRSSTIREQALRSAGIQPKGTPEIAGLEAELRNQPQSAPAYTHLAAAVLKTGDLARADFLLQRARMAYLEAPLDRLELGWVSAELAAQKGDISSAVTQGLQVVQSYQMQGIQGPGSFGRLMYASLMFRSPASAMEMVPQVILIPLTDTWAERILQLGDWQLLLGDKESARKTYSDLLKLVPDNAEAQQKLQEIQ